jgi:hypothetical protein
MELFGNYGFPDKSRGFHFIYLSPFCLEKKNSTILARDQFWENDPFLGSRRA